MTKVLIATAGSYGDLHPYIAIAHALQERGAEPTIATSPYYKEKVEAHGIAFHPVRPDLSLDDGALIEALMDRMRGTERVVRMMNEWTRDAYTDLLPAARQTEIILTHPLTVAAVAIAQQHRIPWVSSVLAPMSFVSAYDPPVPAPLPWAIHLRRLGVPVMRAFWNTGKKMSLRWMKDVLEFRRELGLNGDNPLFEGQHSPSLVLALFSHLLAEPQPDWPLATRVTGFPFFDAHHEHDGMPPEVERFLDAGPPPLVFTLGSSAVNAAGDFYGQSIAAARKLGLRALLLNGRNVSGELPAGMMAIPYARHSEVFPRAAAVIHQGGVGTTAQAMRAGRPMLVVPFSHDQPDNAHRMVKLGIGRSVPSGAYNARRAAAALEPLLMDPGYATRAAAIGKQIEAETGAANAATSLLQMR
jgi:rhamnosyltransferase subunit B